MVLKDKLPCDFLKHDSGVFHYFSHNGKATPQFFCTLTSLNSVSEPNNEVCVLGAINKRYEALFNICMYGCMCLQVSVN